MSEFDVDAHVRPMRSLLKPRWWQIRRRLAMRRLRRDHRKGLEALGPEGQQIARDIGRAIEAEILWGDKE